MWFTLHAGECQRLHLHDRQAVWPAPDGTDAEFVLTADVQLTQEVLIATARLLRLRYKIEALEGAMVLGQRTPTPWPGLEALAGHAFEIMLTERGAIIVPAPGTPLPAHLANWAGSVSEGIRSAWPFPPEEAVVGSQWRMVPAIPGGLPPRTSRADIDVTYTLTAMRDEEAEVGVAFAVRLLIEGPRAAMAGEGEGTMKVELSRGVGVVAAERRGVLRFAGRSPARQILSSEMRLQRVG